MRLLRAILRLPRAVAFLVFFLWELLLANLVVAWEVMTPSYNMRPGIVAVPLRSRTDLEITLIANLISLTPGTLSLDLSDDRSTLYVHALHLKTPDDMRARIGKFESKLLWVLR